MNNPKHLVAVDLGSNSFHLVIAREQAGCIQIVHSRKQRVNLATGLDANNVLNQAAISKGVACLAEFSQTFSRLPSSSVRIVATHTLRKAINRDEFIQAAFKVFPYPIEVISGKAEAELIYQGIAHTQPIRGRTLIIDIGGGSTELVIGQHFKPRIVQSLEMGSSGLCQNFFSEGKISEQQMAAAQDFASSMLQPIADRFREFGWKTVIGSSGSIKMIAQAMSELYGDNKITHKRLKRLKKQLIRWGHYDKVPFQSVDSRRLPLLAGAVAILSACFDMLNIVQLSFSSGALREGVLYGLSDSRQDLDIRQRTVNNMAKLHSIDLAFSQRVLLQLQVFFEQLTRASQSLTQSEREFLRWGAQLHEIGIAINSKQRQQHGCYIIEHSDMPGFNPQEQLLIASLIGNHRGKITLEKKETALGPAEILRLIQLLRLAIILTQGRLNVLPQPIKIHYQDHILMVTLTPAMLQQSELMTLLDQEIGAVKKAGLGLQITSD